MIKEKAQQDIKERIKIMTKELVKENVARQDGSRDAIQRRALTSGCNTRELVNNRFLSKSGEELCNSFPLLVESVRVCYDDECYYAKPNVESGLPPHFTHLRKCYAFTLAEVLVTLAVIGIVAAMTIPTLINNYRAAEMKTRLTKSYSLISQAFELMKIDNGGYVDQNSYSKQTFAPVFQRYFKTVKANVGKVNNDMPFYKNFAGNADFSRQLLDDGTLYLPDGTLIFIEDPSIPANHVFIFVDINGVKKPNVLGKDLFGFYISDNKLLPMGANDNAIKKDRMFGDSVPSDEEDDWCNETSNSLRNGLSCTYKALNDKDYFKNIFAK